LFAKEAGYGPLEGTIINRKNEKNIAATFGELLLCKNIGKRCYIK